jgi:hypothetical protein
MISTFKELNKIIELARLNYKNKSKDTLTYQYLIVDTLISGYFRRYYPFVEIKGIRKYLSRSRFFNKKFIDKISAEVKQSRELFDKTLLEASKGYGTDFKVRCSSKDLCVLYLLVERKLVPFLSSHFKPTKQMVLDGMNLNASSGLPTPWFSKNKFINKIEQIIDSVLLQTFDLNNSLEEKQLFSAAFKRFQITSSKMKARLVFCLSYVINAVEKYFDVMLKMKFANPLCPLVHGKTQPEISVLLSRHKEYHALSFDAKGFDIRVPAEIVCVAFELMHCHLGLIRGSYYSNLFLSIRDLLLCMSCYHPLLKLTDRKRGVISGSGLTSSLNSYCMFSMHTLCLINYCKLHNKNIFRCVYHIYVSGDDSVIFSRFKINELEYMDIFKRLFDIELELENKSDKHSDVCYFLGSKWVNGKPYRDINRMFGRILFGSPNIPRMDSDYLLFCSRCYDILGNVANFEDIWKDFKLIMPDRIFRFAELMDFEQRIKFRKMDTLDRRGFWSSRRPLERLNDVWTTR